MRVLNADVARLTEAAVLRGDEADKLRMPVNITFRDSL